MLILRKTVLDVGHPQSHLACFQISLTTKNDIVEKYDFFIVTITATNDRSSKSRLYRAESAIDREVDSSDLAKIRTFAGAGRSHP